MTPDLDPLRFPIGTFKPPASISEKQIHLWIAEIEALPDQLKQTVKTLSEEDLNLTYRPNGWTIKQVIHHLADSHMNSYILFKLELIKHCCITTFVTKKNFSMLSLKKLPSALFLE